ncbi:phage terminase small subunit [Brevundimonas nasdae]|uniref:terminase small subunit n=1 Tax=Brevundimonas nasdae TaxID=172043 RepID=UPI001912F444|nr:terminase small subunit [Brevundimonas nasdae]MBK6024526.1 terminase small subunit [Brevundimonas nasdae]MDQ0453612.1 phage terminase small subunit [Brevundimonas nasdae]
MPALSNPKHERFALALAKGKGQAEAYADAGYKPSEPNASRLTRNDKVQARVSELQERAADKAVITVATITERLLAIAKKAEGKNEAPMLQVARASLMDAAKLNGLVIDKADNTNSAVLTVSYVTRSDADAPVPASPEDYETAE